MIGKQYANAVIIASVCCAGLGVGQENAVDLETVPRGQAGPATSYLPGVEVPKPVPRREEPRADAAPTRERYLLKTDNTIVAGFVEEDGDRYCVRRSGSRMYLPKHTVQTIGDSLQSLYEYRANRIPVKDLALRASLAQWCFDQGMVDLAFAEAQLVLSQDPSVAVAQRITRLCTPKLMPESASGSGSYTPVRGRRSRYADPSHVISQFKRAYGDDLFLKFMDMQNLLITSCGQGSCHGTRHDGPFKFYRRLDGSPGDAKLTSRNLMTLLNAIDYKDPLRSPVLYKALERHGSAPLPPLGGVQDPTYVGLQEWVLEVSRRWSGNEIELDPRRIEPSEEDTDETFAAGRPEHQPVEIIVRRNGRPGVPVLEPGDDIAKIRSGPPLADDAPPKPSAPLEETDGSADPYSPASFPGNRQKPRQERSKSDTSQLIEMKDGRPVVRRVISVSTGKEDGSTFEAAAPPISRRAE